MNGGPGAQASTKNADSLHVSRTGAAPERAIIEEWAGALPPSLLLRMLFGAWLFPAAGLIWIGFASIGLRPAPPGSLDAALGRTQAVAVALVVLTVPVLISAVVRSAPTLRVERPDLSVTGAAGLVAVLAVAAAGLAPDLAPTALPLAAVAGFAALAWPARWIVELPLAAAGPLAALAVGVAFQLTIGWLHVAQPGGVGSAAVVFEGMALAWAAAAAARLDPFDAGHAAAASWADQPVAKPATVDLIPVGPAESDPSPAPSTVAARSESAVAPQELVGASVSSGPGRPRFPEAAVGH
jgi:hypothetical protein